VRYDPEKVRLSEIKAAITKAGYTPLAAADTAAKIDQHKAAKEREIRILKAKLAVAALFSAPLLYVAMGPMLGWPVPAAIDMMNYPLRYALLELLLVIPAIAAGYHFYTVGFRAIRPRRPDMDSLIAIGTSAAHRLQPLPTFLHSNRRLPRPWSTSTTNRRRHRHPELLWKDAGGYLQGPHFGIDQEAHGTSNRRRRRHPRWSGDRAAQRRGGAGDVVMVRPGREDPPWTGSSFRETPP
jgi:hypothetical protein